MLYDVFICHASEDKARFVRPLAEALRDAHIEVWYDEFTLSVGDSIRRSIDKGLTKSRYGIVVLSKAFFDKKWPQYELDGLAVREMAGNDKIILPVWYNISQKEIMQYSPSLAGKVAIRSNVGKKQIVAELKKIVHPTGSPLIEARDEMLAWGITPPVITDKYWLDVIEASNRTPAFGAIIPEDSIWDRWSFPLPSKEEDWGLRLAWTAMQLNWIKEAEELSISPMTHPDQVHMFIDSNPGLFEVCSDYPELLIEYAPQLSIKGFEGRFKETIETEYRTHLRQRERQKKFSPESGIGLTTRNQFPHCDEEWSLRHETFGYYEPVYISEAYFHGGMFGPRVSHCDEAEHLFWLLSEESSWLPKKIREVLILGMQLKHNWPWQQNFKHDEPYEKWETCGTLWDDLYNAKSAKSFKLTEDSKDDLLHRIDLIRMTLKLSEPTQRLLQKFIETKTPQLWIKENKKREKDRSKK